MKVLVLGIWPSPITPILKGFNCAVQKLSGPVTVDFLESEEIEFAVSYRYRHIIRSPVIKYLEEKIINLHISFLPWNRGADPNLWSFLEDTPKGFTIHYLDEGLDSGDIIVQKQVTFDTAAETLRTTYEKLNNGVLELFRQEWPSIAHGNAGRVKQPTYGSIHRSKDKDKFMYLLTEKGWDTPVEKVLGKAVNKSNS